MAPVGQGQTPRREATPRSGGQGARASESIACQGAGTPAGQATQGWTPMPENRVPVPGSTSPAGDRARPPESICPRPGHHTRLALSPGPFLRGSWGPCLQAAHSPCHSHKNKMKVGAQANAHGHVLRSSPAAGAETKVTEQLPCLGGLMAPDSESRTSGSQVGSESCPPHLFRAPGSRSGLGSGCAREQPTLPGTQHGGSVVDPKMMHPRPKPWNLGTLPYLG